MNEKTIADRTFPTFETTADEMSVGMSGPAILSNRFFASNTLAGVRIGFCETSGIENTPAVFRTAVVLSFQDAAALRDLLTHQLQGVLFIESPTEEAGKDG